MGFVYATRLAENKFLLPTTPYVTGKLSLIKTILMYLLTTWTAQQLNLNQLTIHQGFISPPPSSPLVLCYFKATGRILHHHHPSHHNPFTIMCARQALHLSTSFEELLTAFLKEQSSFITLSIQTEGTYLRGSLIFSPSISDTDMLQLATTTETKCVCPWPQRDQSHQCFYEVWIFFIKGIKERNKAP